MEADTEQRGGGELVSERPIETGTAITIQKNGAFPEKVGALKLGEIKLPGCLLRLSDGFYSTKRLGRRCAVAAFVPARYSG